MSQTNVVDFLDYRDHQEISEIENEEHGDDLISAIQKLIKRLRESSPI